MSGDEPNPDSVKDLFGLMLEAGWDDAAAGETAALRGDDAALMRDAQQAWESASPALQQAARDLLDAHRRARGVLLDGHAPSDRLEDAADRQSPALLPDPDLDAFTIHPPTIRDYELHEELGRGGFGVVYRATQLQPVHRTVAVKMLRTELATPEIAARFRAEAKVLARMNHPGIARVLDAGADTLRRPFVTMELVDGEPITLWCEQRDLAVRDRVRLMKDVCQAVHHAHQRAVIHRDLKPANVLVEMIDGRAQPRVIDFGIARIIEEQALEHRTLTGARLGTPRYMSPEQARGDEQIDVRTDVYALGILLCETLTGQVPREPAGTGDASGSRPRTAATRPSQLAALGSPDCALRSRELRGDLDRIVLKAAALADDLARYLDGRPVRATPPHPLYLLRRFVMRRRAASAAILLAIASLIAGTAAALFGLSRANESRLAAEYARDEAQRERDRAEAMTDFLLGDLIDALNPDLTGDSDRSIATLLRHVAHEADHRLAGDPRLLTDVLTRLGAAMYTVTDHVGAADTLRRATALSIQHHGPEDRRTLHLRIDALLASMSARRLDGIEAVAEAILSDASATFGDDDPVTLRAALHAAHITLGDPVPAMQRVIDAHERAGRTADPHYLEALRFLAVTLKVARDPRAGPLFTKAADLADAQFGPQHSLALELRRETALVLHAEGESIRADSILAEVAERSQHQYGPLNWHREAALNARVRIALEQQRADDALALAETLRDIALRRHGEGSRQHAAAGELIEAAVAMGARDRAAERK